jgi:hypothetical protein
MRAGVCELESVVSIYIGKSKVLQRRFTSKGSTESGKGELELCPNETERAGIKN